MKILLVDDKSVILEQLATFLEQKGHIVDKANNGLAAFEISHNTAYDLFIIDHLMPLMDGIKLVENLRQQAETQTSPIVFMTTQEVKSIADLPALDSVMKIFAKPVDKEALSSLISSIESQNSHRITL